jgi:hypothetical protein
MARARKDFKPPKLRKNKLKDLKRTQANNEILAKLR